MSTTIRPDVSKKNQYWIDRNRYYELKHFCLQYPKWVELKNSIEGVSAYSQFRERIQTSLMCSITEMKAIDRMYYTERIEMLERAANCTDEHLGRYILESVTQNYSYNYLRLVLGIPCSRGVYYKLYRKFFWILDKLRN